MTQDLAVERAIANAPTSWRVEQFRRLASLATETRGTRDIPLLSLSSAGVISPRKEDGGLGKQAPAEDTMERYWIANPGDLVVNPMWLIGGGIGVSRISGAVSPDYRVYHLLDNIYPPYIHYLLRSQPYRDQYRLYTRADTTFDRRVSKENFHPMPILVPPLEEQRRIADFLDGTLAKATRFEEARTEQARLLGERLSSIWGGTITGLQPCTPWVPLRRFIVSITDGPFGSSLASDHYTDSGCRVIRLGNIGAADFRNKNRAYIDPNYARSLSRHSVMAGDLLIAGLGDENYPLGRACIAPEDIGPAIVKADCFRVRLDQTRLSHTYAAWALSSPPVSEQVALLARGATRARINLDIARQISIPVPPLPEQTRISKELSEKRAEMLRIWNLCNSQLALLSERKQAVITAAVTGKIDVTTARGV